MNLCMFVGRFTRDPELRFTQTNKAVANFSLAIDNPKKNGQKVDPNYFDFVAWEDQAEKIAKWFHKGDPIIIRDCAAYIEKFTDKEGNTRSKIKFKVWRFEFVPTNQGRSRDGETEAPDAGERAGEQEAPEETPRPPRRQPQAKPAPTQRERSLIDADDDEEDIDF